MTLRIETISRTLAADTVIAHHYLHRRAPFTHPYGLFSGDELVGVVTFGIPPSRHLQKSACPANPDLVLELNRLWVHDSLPPNTASWFVSRALKRLPTRIIVSYADPQHGHLGYVYRALNFRYSGWTDMDRKTPRSDYIPHDPTLHTRTATRSGYSGTRPRTPKVKYWTVTGPTRTDRRRMDLLCAWPRLDWKVQPPPEVSPST